MLGSKGNQLGSEQVLQVIAPVQQEGCSSNSHFKAALNLAQHLCGHSQGDKSMPGLQAYDAREVGS